MAAQVIRVAQVTGACDDIRFRARCRVRQRTHVRKGDMRAHRELSEVQDDAGCIMCMRIKLPCGIQGCRVHGL